MYSCLQIKEYFYFLINNDESLEYRGFVYLDQEIFWTIQVNGQSAKENWYLIKNYSTVTDFARFLG